MFATLQDELIAKGRAEGKTEGKAELLLELLDSRELNLTEAHGRRVRECKDEALLQRWFHRALTANEASEVFED